MARRNFIERRWLLDKVRHHAASKLRVIIFLLNLIFPTVRLDIVAGIRWLKFE